MLASIEHIKTQYVGPEAESMAQEMNYIVDRYLSSIAQLVRALERKANCPGSSPGPGENFSL